MILIAYIISAFAIAVGAAALLESKRRYDMCRKELDMAIRRCDRQDYNLSQNYLKLADELAKLTTLKQEEDNSMEERIATRIEKKWNDGLQSLMDYNPATGRYDG